MCINNRVQMHENSHNSCNISLCSTTQQAAASARNKMKLCVLMVLGTLLVLSEGMPPINRDYNTHCRCLQVESRIIPPDNLRSIKLFPEGPHCPDTEVIAGLANGAKVCLNPHSSWVKKLINFVLEKQQTGTASKNLA